MVQKTIIQFNKIKVLGILLISAIFVAMGTWSIVDFYSGQSLTSGADVVLAYAVVVFFGYGVFKGIKGLFGNYPAYIIDDTGIVYDGRNPQEGRVDWEDVATISESEISIGLTTQKFIVIQVKNPDAFIGSKKSAITRKLLTYNLQKVGGPVAITSVGVKATRLELFSIITEAHKAYLDSAGVK
jgi:hypothetical protein